MTAQEPVWLRVARRDADVREIPGKPTAPRIAHWLRTLQAWWADDETPWCGTAVAAWMQQCGITPPKDWMRALAWANWGAPLAQPLPGCVVVFRRDGGGHVGLVTGRAADGRLLVWGGNQGNAVNERPFDTSRVVAYRWPPGFEAWTWAALPVRVAAGASSSNEA